MLKQVVKQVNHALAKSDFADFQLVRAKRRGLSRPRTSSVFSSNTTFPSDEFPWGYAYHDGGRTELQFNVAFERPGHFRYGLGISLRPGQSMPAPLPTMGWRIARLNEYLVRNPDTRQKLSLYYYDWARKRHDLPGVEIPDHVIADASFIFVGKRLKIAKNLARLSRAQLDDVVQIFRELREIYDNVEAGALASEDFRAARIVWNTRGWQKPSGADGKLNTERNFESRHGFGHEEWNLRQEWLIDGFHYGFLQTFNHHNKTYAGRKFNVILWSKDDATKNRYAIARIRNLECLSDEDGRKIMAAYKKRGWTEQMKQEVLAVGGDPWTIGSEEVPSMINCCFRLEDLEIFDEPRPQFFLDDPHLQGLYYDTLTKLPPSRFEEICCQVTTAPVARKELTDLSAYNIAHVKKIARHEGFAHQASEIDLLHKRWQEQLLKELRAEFGKQNVGAEVPLDGGRADIIILADKRRYIIELKTARSAMRVVKEALAQLLVYAYLDQPDKIERVMVACGPVRLDRLTGEFLEKLRKEVGLPLWYVQYDEQIKQLKGFETVRQASGKRKISSARSSVA